jgi:hypothetical protein
LPPLRRSGKFEPIPENTIGTVVVASLAAARPYGPLGHNDVDAKADEFSRKCAEAIVPRSAVSGLDYEVPALDIPKLFQPFAQGHQSGRHRSRREHADPNYRRNLLCHGSEWPGEHHAADYSDEITALHSIISSARTVTGK